MTLDIDRLNRKLAPLLARLLPREPRWRYYGDKHGYRFCYTTERMPDGKFHTWIYRPTGKGARSGAAREWKLTHLRKFARRKAAKACAKKRFLQASFGKAWKEHESHYG